MEATRATPSGMGGICADLAAEHADLDALVAPLDGPAWDTPTPAPGWSVRDQIGHLAFFDEAAALAASDPDEFSASLRAAGVDPEGFMNRATDRARSATPDELLGWWRGARRDLLSRLETLDPSARLPWYGPSMGARSFATARLMETWAHGQDIADGLGATRAPTGRLRHVCHIGVAALPFSFAAHGLDAPQAPVRVELQAPDGTTWEWGPADAGDKVTGTALDFALVVTQRRHRDDTDLRATGPVARRWLGVAQAFAGPPGAGRQPGQFPRAR